jgi:hypothetical protein
VISTSGSFEAAGTLFLGGGRPLTCPGTFCFAFSLTAFSPIIWVIWMVSVDACSMSHGYFRRV